MKAIPMMIVGALLGTSLMLSAQPADKPAAENKHAQKQRARTPLWEQPDGKIPPKFVLKFDANGDGKLSKDERESMKMALQNAKAERGKVTPEQRREAGQKRKAEMKREHQKLLAKYDVDHDGKLSKAERAAVSKDRTAELTKKYDTNHDGKLDPAERAAIPLFGPKM